MPADIVVGESGFSGNTLTVRRRTGGLLELSKNKGDFLVFYTDRGRYTV